MSKFFAEEHTRVLQEVIREIETDPAEYLGAKYMPSIEVPATTIFLDVWEARGGVTNEHAVGTDPLAIPKRSFRTQEYSPGAYKEFVRFNEKEILRLRALGQNDQSQRGIRQHLNENALVLNNRIESRMELMRWQAIFNGTYLYDGKSIDFGKPANHDVAPAAPWLLQPSPGVTVANPAATPIQDLRYWLMGGYQPFRKYKKSKMIMNPNTARGILDNPNVQSLIQSRFAAETYKMHDVNEVIQFLVPGAPPVEIYEGWFQSESIDNVTGAITVSDAIYFIPDGRIFFECKLPNDNKVGDVVMTLSLANGSVDNPAPGKFILVDEHIEDRPGNPYIDIFGGFYGGPRLKRAFDLLTATVI
jgi:hypothetical protein